MILNPFTIRDLRRLEGFIDVLRTVGMEFSIGPFIFSGLLLRESGATYGGGYFPKGSIIGWGDNHNGFGPFQLDKRFHTPFINSPQSAFLPAQARYAAGILASNRLRLMRLFPLMSEHEILRATLASYNALLSKVKFAIASHKDVDSVTTGKDYSAWIIRKADVLRLAKPSLFSISG